jgi:hypothetical protein
MWRNWHKAQTTLHGFAVDLLADRLYSKSTANPLMWFDLNWTMIYDVTDLLSGNFL